jgi:hypothetical protein
MDTINVGSSFSYAHVNEEIVEEEEYDVDEEGKGLTGAPYRSVGKLHHSRGQVALQDMVDIWNGPTDRHRSN